MPHSLVSYVSARGRAIELLRSLANSLALRNPSVKRAYSTYDLVFSANVETSTVIAPMCRGEVVLRPEVAAKRLLPVVESSRESRDSLVVGFAGRLHYGKGAVLLLDCVQQMSTPFQLLVAGDGEERPRIEAGIRERHLEGRVELLGRIPYDGMADFYRRIDVLAFPSFREATGSVVVEALAAGVPVVSLGIFGASVVLADNPDFLVKCEGDSCDVVDRYAATLDSYARGELVFDWSSRERLLIGKLASFFEDSYRAGVTL